MPGERLLLDTNAVVALLRGSQPVLDLTRRAEWIGISIISELEFLCFRNLTEQDRACFCKFRERVDVLGLDAENAALIEAAVRLRKEYRLRIPDAVIGATAAISRASLVTADRDFERVSEITTFSFA